MSTFGFLQKRKFGDDLEYNITFPSVPSASYGDHEPVVFLLGWTGCKDKILAKYSLMYENAGCITIRYIHPTQYVMMNDPAYCTYLQEAAAKLFALLDDYDLKQHPVLVHCFSNGGYWVYRYMADIFYVSDVNMIGVIGDCCPERRRFITGLRVICAGGVAPNKFVAFIFMIGFFFLYLFWRIRNLFRRHRNKPIYQYMQESPYHTWPHLFLYSSADKIVPASDVVEMARSRRQNGSINVSKYDFKTSDHVMIYRDHAKTYKDKCVAFLQSCIQVFDAHDIHSDVTDDTCRERPLSG